MPLTTLPFPLPPAFLERLGYRGDRRIVGIHFEPVLDEVEFTDGIRSLIGADPYVYRELTHRPEVRAWLHEHAINLGNSDQPATHWFLVDRATDRAYVCDAASARDRVRGQVLEDWAG